MKTSPRPVPICFAADATAAKCKNVKPVRRRDAMTFSWCSLNQSNSNMPSAKRERHFDSQSARCGITCWNASRHHRPPRAGTGLVRLFIPLQCFQKQYAFPDTVATWQLLLDISIICTRFDLTKAIGCQWHLASARGDRQVREVSRQHTGPGGIAKVGVV